MIHRPILTIMLALPSAALAAADLPAVASQVACSPASFAAVGLPEAPTAITAASVQDVGGHQMCVVTGTISPAISFQVNLPVSGWTQRYLQTGCGGLCGRVGIESPNRDCAIEQAGGFAMASTDMGHSGQGGIWGASDMQTRVDFGYRGVHVTALIAKQVIAAYYGQAPAYSYFSGCSDGGREALMAAQRYPEDFDGIAAGAPALNFLVQNSMYHGWNAHIVHPQSDSPALVEADLAILHAGAVAACDGADGTVDGLVSDPSCRFDPATLVCPEGQAEGCLGARAAQAAAELYRGAHEGDTALVVGSMLPGSELNWAGVAVAGGTPPGGLKQAAAQDAAKAGGPPPAMDQVNMGGPGMALSPKVASEMLQSLAYVTPYDPAWRLEDFTLTRQSLEDMRPMHAIYDATNPDLGPFQAAGGKLILWHGLADPHISPLNSIAYAQAVRATIGEAATDDMMRSFLIPGMGHCSGGDLASVDVMTPLMDWVESGSAPQVLVASANDAAAAAGQGRALYPFPAISVLKPGGNPDSPGDWQQGPDSAVSPTRYKDWAGADFFTPGFQKSCGFEGFDFVCRPAN